MNYTKPQLLFLLLTGLLFLRPASLVQAGQGGQQETTVSPAPTTEATSTPTATPSLSITTTPSATPTTEVSSGPTGGAPSEQQTSPTTVQPTNPPPIVGEVKEPSDPTPLPSPQAESKMKAPAEKQSVTQIDEIQFKKLLRVPLVWVVPETNVDFYQEERLSPTESRLLYSISGGLIAGGFSLIQPRWLEILGQGLKSFWGRLKRESIYSFLDKLL